MLIPEYLSRCQKRNQLKSSKTQVIPISRDFNHFVTEQDRQLINVPASLLLPEGFDFQEAEARAELVLARVKP